MTQRPHGADQAAAGHLGTITTDEYIGPCPSCGAELRACNVADPYSGRIERALVHPIPFCSYFGDTDPGVITADVDSRRS